LAENLRLEVLRWVVMTNLAGSFGAEQGAKVEALYPPRLRPSGQARKIPTLSFVVNNFNMGRPTAPKAVSIDLSDVRINRTAVRIGFPTFSTGLTNFHSSGFIE
jgi:hypothetical protein